MRLQDFYVSQQERFSTGIDPLTGKCYVQIQISVSAVDYEIDHEIAEDVARDPEAHMTELLPLVRQLREDEIKTAYERMRQYVATRGKLFR